MTLQVHQGGVIQRNMGKARLKTLGPRVQTAPTRMAILTPGSWATSDQRKSSTARGYTYRWQKEREAFLKDHPICECEECAAAGRIRASTVVDHKIPHRGDRELFWRKSNWQAMSKPCHDAKTRRGE